MTQIGRIYADFDSEQSTLTGFAKHVDFQDFFSGLTGLSGLSILRNIVETGHAPSPQCCAGEWNPGLLQGTIDCVELTFRG